MSRVRYMVFRVDDPDASPRELIRGEPVWRGATLAGATRASSTPENIGQWGSAIYDVEAETLDYGFGAGEVVPVNPRRDNAPLTAAERRALPRDMFAIPESKDYPIDTHARAVSALARVEANGTPEEIRRVRAAVHARYPHMLIKALGMTRRRNADTWDVIVRDQGGEPVRIAEATTRSNAERVKRIWQDATGETARIERSEGPLHRENPVIAVLGNPAEPQPFMDRVEKVWYIHETEGPRYHNFDAPNTVGEAMPDGSIRIRHRDGTPMWVDKD